MLTTHTHTNTNYSVQASKLSLSAVVCCVRLVNIDSLVARDDQQFLFDVGAATATEWFASAASAASEALMTKSM